MSRFLPPDSFLEMYDLLVYAVYQASKPTQTTPAKHVIKKGGASIPVRNYAAYRKLRRIDQRMYDLAREIREFLYYDPDEVNLAEAEKYFTRRDQHKREAS